MDPIRRKILKTGAAATVMAAAPRVLAQQTGQGGAPMSFYEKGPVRIQDEVVGSGFPLLLIAGGGLNSTIGALNSPFNAMRNSRASTAASPPICATPTAGSLPARSRSRPWDAYTDDHLAVMDHLGIEKFTVMGFCIGGPFIWNLLRRAPTASSPPCWRSPAARVRDARSLLRDQHEGLGPRAVTRRPEITMEMVDRFLTRMYRSNGDFVFTVTRDFVRQCQTPVLILPDDIPAHPYAARWRPRCSRRTPR